jgi:hypothetical protein
LKKEYYFEVVETAENLYIYKQKTYEEIASITGVSVAQIQRWSEKYEWRKKKLDYVKRRVEYRKSLYTVRDDFLDTARTSKDPQVVHALKALQGCIDAEEKMASASEAGSASPEVFLAFMRDMVGFLKERDPEALQALEKNFDEFMSFAKEKYKTA